MTPDPLDDLLTRSAPGTRGVAPDALGTMIAEAREEARPRRRPRPVVFPLALGVSALLIGSAGVAAATDGFSWAPWAQEPVGTVSFTMAAGFECELRFTRHTGGADPGFVSDVDHILESWYRTTDVVAQARPLVPEKRAYWMSLQNPADEAQRQRQLSELSDADREEAVAHHEWSMEWIAWELAVSDLELEAVEAGGHILPDPRMAGAERVSGIQCLDLDGRPYVPGAGS